MSTLVLFIRLIRKMSSFRRRKLGRGALSTLPGTRVSAYNSSVLLSTGIASIDDILGGGCPSGSILLIEEDQDTSYAKLLLKYWIAQGICSGDQRVAVVSHHLDQRPEEIIARLPYSDDATHTASTHTTRELTDDEDDVMADASENSMKIAFRYEHLKKFETSVKTTTSTMSEVPFCSTYDLTKSMDLTKGQKSRISLCDAGMDEACSCYLSTLGHIEEWLEHDESSQSAKRIAIQSIASPLWGDFDVNSIFQFLQCLKLLLRKSSSTAAVMVTMPGYLIRSLKNGPSLLRRLEWACDGVIELESFAGSPSLSSVFPAYSGFLHIHRLPTPNSMLPPSAKLSVLRGLAPGANSTSSGAGGMDNNLGFKLKRRRGLMVETLHLDEGGGTSERRTTPSASHPEVTEAELVATQEQPTASEVANETPTVKTTSFKTGGERRRIRFDDDPNENPTGILGGSKKTTSGYQRDNPKLYEF